MCDDKNYCNEQINLHEDMLDECKVIEDGDTGRYTKNWFHLEFYKVVYDIMTENPTDDKGDDEDEESSATALALGATLLFSLLC